MILDPGFDLGADTLDHVDRGDEERLHGAGLTELIGDHQIAMRDLRMHRVFDDLVIAMVLAPGGEGTWPAAAARDLLAGHHVDSGAARRDDGSAAGRDDRGAAVQGEVGLELPRQLVHERALGAAIKSMPGDHAPIRATFVKEAGRAGCGPMLWEA